MIGADELTSDFPSLGLTPEEEEKRKRLERPLGGTLTEKGVGVTGTGVMGRPLWKAHFAGSVRYLRMYLLGQSEKTYFEITADEFLSTSVEALVSRVREWVNVSGRITHGKDELE